MIIDAKSPEGNAFNIIAAVKKYLIEEAGMTRNEAELNGAEMMMLGSYDEICDYAKKATYGIVVVVNRFDD